MAEIVTVHKDCNLILCGDFNARTGVCDDFIVDDDMSYIHDFDWYPEDNFNMNRKSRDNDGRINIFGYALLDICKTFGIHIVNGRSPDDPDGEFTFGTSNGSSVVDYVIASTELFPRISMFKVDNYDISDHFPLCCHIQCCLPGERAAHVEGEQYSRYRWLQEKRDEFRELLLDDQSKAQLRGLSDKLSAGFVNDSVQLLETSV